MSVREAAWACSPGSWMAGTCGTVFRKPSKPPLSPEQVPLVPDSHPTDDEATEGAERSET